MSRTLEATFDGEALILESFAAVFVSPSGTMSIVRAGAQNRLGSFRSCSFRSYLVSPIARAARGIGSPKGAQRSAVRRLCRPENYSEHQSLQMSDLTMTLGTRVPVLSPVDFILHWTLEFLT